MRPNHQANQNNEKCSINYIGFLHNPCFSLSLSQTNIPTVDLDEENHVCALNGRDNMDDYGLLPKFIDDDELMADMNKELDEYKKYLDGLK